jgi:glycosyltransferase involved in cell wall biosynthesis
MLKLSIAIPTYNRKDVLQETLASILPQMTEEVEIVISDNGSEDGTREWLQHYSMQHAQIQVVGFESNQGIDRNIVNVLSHCLGEYVFLFSDDDVLLPDSLKKILQELKEKHPVAMCLNHFAFKHPHVHERTPSFLPTRRKVFTSGEDFFVYCGLGFLSSLIFKRDKAFSYFSSVNFGWECAHLEILSRIVLCHPGLYIYKGEVSVAGRALAKPRYDLIYSCILYPKKVYDTLLQQRLLQKKSYLVFVKRLMYRDVPRIVYKCMQIATYDVKLATKLLREEFKNFYVFQILMKALNSLNKNFLLCLFRNIHFLISLKRILILKLNRK